MGTDWYDWRGWRQGGPQGEVGKEEGATSMTVSLRGKEREAGVVVAAAEVKGEQPEQPEQKKQKQQP